MSEISTTPAQDMADEFFDRYAKQAAELYPEYAGWRCEFASREIDYIKTSPYDIFEAARTVINECGDGFNDEEEAEHFETFDLPTKMIGVALRNPNNPKQKRVFMLLPAKA